MIVNLSAQDLYPEYPEIYRLPVDTEVKKKVTRSNVWRKFRVDTEEDLILAFQADIQTSFNPELFIKNPDDVEECKRIL